MSEDQLFQIAEDWFKSKKWESFEFQRQTWEAYLSGKSGLLNAPTGSGKTYALWIPCVLEFLRNHKPYELKPEVQILWITPLRALAKDIQHAMQVFCDDIDVRWQIGLRTGDTTTTERQKQKKKLLHRHW